MSTVKPEDTTPEVNPNDSASQCGSRSSAASSRTKKAAAARKAALEAEAAVLKEQQELELQALKLQQKLAALKLKSQIVIAEAEERALSECSSSTRHSPSDILPAQLQDDTIPYPVADQSLIKVLQDGQIHQQRLIESVTLPQADLMKFDGNPLKYWEFWRSFENSVDKTSVEDSIKLTRLLHFCTGDAHKLLHACLVMEPSEGYRKAKQMLKDRFGNPYRIADAWMQRVTQGNKIAPNNKKAIQDMADELNICVQTLEAMGYKSELSPQSVLLAIVERLPFYLRDRWLKTVAHIRKEDRLPRIDDLLNFIQSTASQQNDPVYGRLTDFKPGSKEQSFQKSGSSPKSASNRNVKSKGQRSSYSTSSNTSPPSYVRPCLLCKQTHTLFGCDQFKKLAPDKRLQFAKDKQLCFNCLRKGHMLTECRLNRTCSVEGCGRKHTKFLHQINKPQRSEGPAETPPENPTSDSTASNGYVDTASNNVIGAGGRSVLPIVPVRVQSDGRNFIDTYALLDSGSTHSFCTDALSRQLGAKGQDLQLRLTTLDKDDDITTTMVSMIVDTGPSTERVYLPHVCTRKKLNIQTCHMAKVEDIVNLPHLKGIDIPLAGENEVGLLIGQDAPRALMPLEIRKGDKGPYAIRTALGWSLHGQVPSSGSVDVSTHFIQGDISLDVQVQKFWKLEDERCLYDDEKGMSFNDRRALEIWEKTITTDNGHYQLAIPFKERPPSLEDNHYVAEKRLESLGVRLRKDPQLHEKYKEGIADLLHKGYAEEVVETDDNTSDKKKWYIPHHPVFHPMKPGKVRIVFDCASKYKGQSLNDVVLQGPDLTNKLTGVLLRFRQERIAMIADVEAMFHQVRVPPEDRDVLRFLWWSDGDMTQEPKTYRMCVHLFGGTWSPSCCNFAMRRTADDNQCSDDAARVVHRNFYVDDCLVSLSQEEQAIELAAEVKSLLQKGGFHLTKWLSNNPRVLQSIPKEDQGKQVSGLDLNHEALPVERALGMRWDIEQDCFTYKISPKDKPSTRRGLLSIVSSVYDPLGYASPCVLQAKLILQELTRLKLGWDDTIPSTEAQKWDSWLDQLPEMEEFEVNRCVKPHDFGEVIDYQLHNFADASEVAYGAVSYITMRNEEGQVHCSLLMAKTHLAPVKTTTIPRLELLAATLATKMDTMIRRELDFPISKSTFWTDSMIVLSYIQNKEKRFRTFVANRLAVIHAATEIDNWRHIESALNPADIVSRGMPAKDLKESSEWMKGPEFLEQPEELWPTSPTMKQEISNDDPEVKAAKEQSFAITSNGEDCVDKLIGYYSDWTKLRRGIAWWLRLKKVLREKIRETKPNQDKERVLTTTEIEAAERAILQYVQRHSFSDEIPTLSGDENSAEASTKVKKGSKLYKLDPILQEGLLKVGGRLRNAKIPNEAKHQVILPKKHHVTSLIVRHTHHRVGHQGQNHVLSQIRQRYWILGAGVVVRSILKKCVNCRKYQAKVCSQKMADLPSFRLEAMEPAFTYVGMDYFGPFDIKCGRSIRKRYGVVFTCMTTRAIHIEVADTLDTSSCIDAIRRMMSRRGPIKKIVSDNGTNLVGAKTELKKALSEWNEEEIAHFTANHGTEWTFNPPTASHQGGVWERQIRTIRKVLHGILSEQYLRTCQSEEQLRTLMCETEAIINSRPLTRVSDDADDLGVLTPNSLLLMKQVTEPPPGKFTSGDVYARKRWRQMQYLADLFWKRWLREYLPDLQQRQRWQQPGRNVQNGDVVLIADETAPRCSWLMGRVLETYPDNQGFVRSVKVKTATSTLIRPITKLCLLLEQEV